MEGISQSLITKANFFHPPVQRGKLVTITGEAGVGKTHMSNFFFNPDTTCFIDTEPINTTIETLDKLNQMKVWKATDLFTLNSAVDSFLTLMKNAGLIGTLVVDSGSVVKAWITDDLERQKGRKLAPFEHEPVKFAMRDWIKKIVVDGGHNLIMTQYLKANYTPNVVENNRITQYGTKDGTFGPVEWEEMPYHASFAFQLERGIFDPATNKRLLDYKVFVRVRKTRSINENFKPYIIPPLTHESCLRQLSTPYMGGIPHVMAELYRVTDDTKLKRDLEKMYKGSDEWARLAGLPVEAKLPTTPATKAKPGAVEL